MRFGTQSMFEPLRAALVRSPDESFEVSQPSEWGYASRPNLPQARQEHQELVTKLQEAGVKVLFHRLHEPGLADSIFVFDPVLMTPSGAVMLRMGKAQRAAEIGCMEKTVDQLEIPVLGGIEAPGQLEGGDLLWLDAHTIAAGLGFRSNGEGIRQLSGLLKPLEIRVISVELPFHTGPGHCLHLLSLISMLDHDLAVVHPPLMSVPFYQELQSRGIELVEIPESEFATQASNVLALGPRRLLMLEENVETIRKLEARNCEVTPYRGLEISHKAEGGPTCLVLPLHRGA